MISIFAKLPYLLDDPKGGVYLQRLTGRVRGEEIAQYLRAKFNPTGGYENDVCIYVKPASINHVKDGSYIDVLDDKHAVEILKKRPKVKAIAMCQIHYEYLKTQLKNEIVIIPHHNINHERVKRSRKKIITCGYVGKPSIFDYRVNRGIRKELAKIGLDFVPFLNYKTRQDIVDFYKTVDIQIIGYFNHYDHAYRHPTKIINAASFGIPTIAAPISGYKEIEGYYIPVNDMESLVAEAEKLKDQKYYDEWAAKVYKESEKYHISEIAKLYQQLV